MFWKHIQKRNDNEPIIMNILFVSIPTSFYLLIWFLLKERDYVLFNSSFWNPPEFRRFPHFRPDILEIRGITHVWPRHPYMRIGIKYVFWATLWKLNAYGKLKEFWIMMLYSASYIHFTEYPRQRRWEDLVARGINMKIEVFFTWIYFISFEWFLIR